jgi:putative aldouronate transport system substrate-binding protein
MQVLNELYTNADLMTLYCWGEEGKEWVETGDGHITFPEGINAQNSEYFNNTNWELPNQFIARVWEGDDLTIWEQMQKFNDEAQASCAMGFTYSNADYATEYTALSNIYSQYQASLELGFVDPDVAIPEMLEKMKKAGLDEYIQAKQDAIDAWAAKK